MSNSLYEEALADAKKLKDVAEQNAKNAIIDAVTPKIRDLIENQLVGDARFNDNQDIVQEIADDMDEDQLILTPESSSKLIDLEHASRADKLELDVMRLRENLATVLTEDGLFEDELTQTQIKEEIQNVYSRLEELKNILNESSFSNMQEQLESLYAYVINNTSREGSDNKENKMSRNRKDRHGESFLDEAELRLILNLPDVDEEDLEDADVSLDLGVEDEEVDVDAEEDVEVGDEEVEVGEEESFEEWFVIDDDVLTEADDDDDDDDDDDGEEVDEGEMKVRSRGGQEEMSWEDDHDEGEEPFLDETFFESVLDLDDDVVLEINENMLRQELARMTRINESRTPRRQRRPTRSRTQSRVSPRKNGEVKELRNAVGELRNQLNESNLFNAKLLYANKLLQRKGLTDRQKIVMVESLDAARSLREVRLVYKSLSDSLRTTKKRLGESAQRRVLGSSSRATPKGGSSSKRDELVAETKRWALLAGISEQ